jgi:23S rRNA (uracil1939-C5)-methyltransferase
LLWSFVFRSPKRVRETLSFVIVAAMPAPPRPRGPASSSAGKARDQKPQKHQRQHNKPGKIQTLRIESLAAGGAGVAHLEGGAAVFIQGAAPGDLVEADVHTDVRPARGKLLRILEAGPDRIGPGCSFAVSCGGCDWMHLTPGAQEEAHAEIVRQAIRRATSLDAIPEIRIHPAPAAIAYRTRARLFAKASGGRARIGYRAAGTHDLAVVDACIVLDAAIAQALTDIPTVLQGASGEGDILVARGAGGNLVVELLWRGALQASTWASLDERVKSGAWAGARVHLEGVAKPASFGDPRARIEGADGLPLLIAPGGFAQASDEGAKLLARRVAELATLDPGKTKTETQTQTKTPVVDEASSAGDPPRPLHIVELFAGSGTLSILLARGAASFTAVELEEDAVQCARQNLADRGLAAKHITADANAFPIPQRTELVVLDPPRAGAPGAVRNIIAASPRVIVYVACDPATLARDLTALIAGGYALTDIETFELFPQTSHIETVVRLVKKRGR